MFISYKFRQTVTNLVNSLFYWQVYKPRFIHGFGFQMYSFGGFCWILGLDCVCSALYMGFMKLIVCFHYYFYSDLLNYEKNANAWLNIMLMWVKCWVMFLLCYLHLLCYGVGMFDINMELWICYWIMLVLEFVF